MSALYIGCGHTSHSFGRILASSWDTVLLTQGVECLAPGSSAGRCGHWQRH